MILLPDLFLQNPGRKLTNPFETGRLLSKGIWPQIVLAKNKTTEFYAEIGHFTFSMI